MNTATHRPHLAEEDLVLHYYGEMSAADESAAAAHLRECAECHQQYTALQRVLGAIDEATFSPVYLPPSFEGAVWARLEPALQQTVRRGSLAWLLSAAPLGLAAAVILLVTAAFFAGRSLAPAPPGPPPAPAAATAEQIRERILLVDLDEHLDRSQMLLVELVSSGDDPDSPADADARSRVEQLAADNRLYRQTAEATGNSTVSELLDEFERLLTELAAAREPMSAQDRVDLRHRIEARDLLFRIRVVSSEIRERQKEAILRKTAQRS